MSSHPGQRTPNSLSIAMCTYNGEAYIAEQLESFVKQTYLPSELVVCDDRSQDGTIPIVQDFARTAPFPVRIQVNQATLGVRKNFERAITLCTGDLIALSDQDDVWQREKLVRSVIALESAPNAAFTNASADHLHVRVSLPERRLVRLPIVLKELVKLRYHRHSSGLRSAVKDLVRA
jgi:glycosyltransferase involved in cell wall biosynthesis